MPSGLLALGHLPHRDTSGPEQQGGLRTGAPLCLGPAWTADRLGREWELGGRGWGLARRGAQAWGL